MENEKEVQGNAKELPVLGDILPKAPQVLEDLTPIDKEKLVNKELTIFEMHFLPSGYGKDEKFAVVKIMVDGEVNKVTLGSRAIVDKLQKVPVDKIPFKATLVTRKSQESGRTYYDIE